MNRLADRRITWAVEHMQRHLAEPLTIPGLAAHVELSPSRFRDLFRAHTGLGPARYLRRLRLRRARLLIERTFLAVTEVMAQVGYRDPGRFTRDFQRLHGMTPSALRSSERATPLPAAEGSPREAPLTRRIRQRRAREPALAF